MPASRYVDLPIHEFLVRLAAAVPTPGGGTVAALTGSLAAALGRMVCAFTLGKPKFAAVESQVRDLEQRLARTDELFRRLMDEDAGAYDQLRAALGIDKTAPDRAAKIAQAARLSGGVPLETAALAHRLLEDLARLREIGNPLLASDAEAAEHLARAALHAAAANVRANLPLMAPTDAEVVKSELERLR
jgi:methenyltetrahydrofolate cyclohydrolase